MDSTDISDSATRSNDFPSHGDPVIAQQWTSPGISVRKRWFTGLGITLVAIIFFLIARSEGASGLVSTIIGVIFIGCFIWYLRIVAPIPFIILIDSDNLTRIDHGSEPTIISWRNIARVKEEHFKKGTTVSITVYKRVGERGLHRAWVVYRDDLPRFDEFVAAVREALPEATPWVREQIHE